MYQGAGSLIVLQNIVESCFDLGFSSYNSKLEQVFPLQEEPSAADLLFSAVEDLPSLWELCEKADAPVIVGTPMEIFWIVDGEKENGTMIRIHAAGPMFLGSMSLASVKKRMEDMHLSVRTSRLVEETLEKLPVYSYSVMTLLGKTMHCCISGKSVNFDDFRYLGHTSLYVPGSDELSPGEVQAHQSNWVREKRMYSLFRNGCLDYGEQMERLGFVDVPGEGNDRDSIRTIKDTVISGITLYSRAAMDGGLAPEIGYPLARRYIDDLERAAALSDIISINGTAMNDFVTRVNRIHRKDGISKVIRDCCEYIHMNVEKVLKVPDIAAHFGYSSYYLSKKFREEMDVSMQEYIARARIEQAKAILRSSNEAIQSISERLHFCNPSYFAATFRRVEGMTPEEYRNQAVQTENGKNT